MIVSTKNTADASETRDADDIDQSINCIFPELYGEKTGQLRTS